MGAAVRKGKAAAANAVRGRLAALSSHRQYGDSDEIYFCAYLNDFPKTAKEYETLKLSLWKKYEHDRDGYTAAKSAFVTSVTKKAKLYYSDKKTD